jgi:D-glycero-D-manno-heptose 1,7-bisphosphate phosphatase
MNWPIEDLEKMARWKEEVLSWGVQWPFNSTEGDFSPEKNGTRPCLFLDRDGIINIDKSYVHEYRNIQWVEGMKESLASLQKKHNLTLIVLTNQSGVGRGYYKESEVDILHKKMGNTLEKEGIDISAWYSSPYHPEGKGIYRRESFSRKPLPGMALMAMRDWDVDFENSVMVGDKPSDRLLGMNLPTAFLKGNYDFKEEQGPIFESWNDLSTWIDQQFS